MGRISGLGRALAHRNYRLFIAGQSISLIGTWMQQLGLAWLVYDLTKSPLLLGVVSFSAQIPAFFLAPVAGVLSDRWNRHRTILVTQCVAMMQAVCLVILTWSGHVQVWHVIVLSSVLGLANAFDIPTRQAFLVDMVPRHEDLPNAIALNSSIVNSARLLGPFLAGLLIAATGVLACFVVNAVSYLAVLAALASMRDLPVRPRADGSIRRGLIEGFSYAFGFPPIRALLLMMATVSLMVMPMTVLLPVFADEVLHGGPRLFGFLTGATGCGALASALYLASRTTVLGFGKKMVWATSALGCGMIAFGFSRSIALSLVLLVVTGGSMMFHMAANNTLLQTIVEEDKRGRVMSLYTMAFMGSAPLGSLVGGTIAERFGAPVAVQIGGTICLVAAAVFAVYLPGLRRLVHPIYERKGILPQVAEAVESAAELGAPPEEIG